MAELKPCKSCEECLDRATLYWGFVVMDCSKCPRAIDAWNKRS